MKSLHTRLDPIKDKVLTYTETFGRHPAMREFEVQDYARFSNWLEEVTGNENFGHSPKISLNGGQSLGDQLVAAFLCKVAQLQAENMRLHKEIEHLKWLLSSSRDREQSQALAILQACQA